MENFHISSVLCKRLLSIDFDKLSNSLDLLSNLHNSISVYAKNYEVLFHNDCNLSNNKIYIGDNSRNKKCRFCNRDSNSTTFSHVSHAIPESLGNKTLICADECDKCNEEFSINIENHLDKITMPYRTINFIKGKNKIPSHKSIDKKFRVDCDTSEKKRLKVIAEQGSRKIDLGDKDKEMSIEIDIQPHIPAAAYKAIVKMALSVMPLEELKNFQIITEWIRCSDHSKTLISPLKVLATFVPGSGVFNSPVVFLFKKISDESCYPSYMFVLAFANIIYQIVIPSDGEIAMQKTTFKILRFPSPFEYGWIAQPKHLFLDWTSCNMEMDKKEKFQFSYDEKIKIDPKDIQM